jgi:N-acetylglucosaminyldiphosphoundecaprenol N-acetyl-beta-D-mannosaminyltransferase
VASTSSDRGFSAGASRGPADSFTTPRVHPVPGRNGVCRIGNLRLAAITAEEAVEWIVDQAVSERPCVVVTSNIFHLMLAERDPDFQRVAATCELNVADGWPLVAASRLLHCPVPERIAGVDLVEGVLHSRERLRVAIMGGAPGVADMLADRFRRNHEIVLVDPLEMGVWQEEPYMEALRARLRAARPNLVLIGIGAPRQELLSDSIRDVASGPIIGCGQTVDVLGGARPRAPRGVQRLGLEWAFRMAMEPRRLGQRYVIAGVGFVRLLVREVRRTRRHARGDGSG